MIMYGYVYFNKKVGAYTPPKFDVYDKDLKAEMDLRAYQLASDKEKVQFDECDLYFVGTFDDKTCNFELLKKPEYILTFGGKKNGGKVKKNN